MEMRLRKEVDICEQQYGFMPGRSTTDPMFALRLLMEKYREGQREFLHVCGPREGLRQSAKTRTMGMYEAV